MVAANPVRKLERGERPRVGRREMRILDRDEIGRLLDAADDRHRALLATATFTGLRLGELLGLVWADVDFEAGVVRVRKQLAKNGVRVEPKTPQAVRDVVLMPALARVLKVHREAAFARGFAQPAAPVFASEAGTPLDRRNVVRRGLERAMQRAKLDEEGRPRLRFHDLRHTFASLLIAQGANVGFVSHQLGHANSAITLSIYEHEFDRVEQAERTRALLEARFGTVLETAGGDGRRLGAEPNAAEVVALQGIRG